MNKHLKDYVVRQLDEEVALVDGKQAKLYIVLKKGMYIGTVKVDLLSRGHEFRLIDFPGVDDELIREDDGYYYETSLAVEAVAQYVLEPIERRHKATLHLYY